MMHNLINRFKAKLRQQKNRQPDDQIEHSKTHAKGKGKQSKPKMTTEEKAIKKQYQQQSPIPIDEDYQMIKQVYQKIKADPNATQAQIAHACYQIKWISYYRETMPSIATLVSDGPTDDFYLNTIGYHRSNSGMFGFKSYNINHVPTKMTRADLLRIARNILESIQQVASDSIVYYLADRIPTSQESEHKMGLTVKDYTPVTVKSIKIGAIGSPPDVESGIQQLRYKAIQNHCNAVYNIKIIPHQDNDDPLDDYSTVQGDLIKLKKHPIVDIKKYGKDYLNNMQLLKDLRH